jgi:hypothetical protein
MPSVFANPSSTHADQGKTVYLLPTGKGSLFEGEMGPAFQDIVDGTSKTILMVEAEESAAVDWTRPEDLSYNPEHPKEKLEHPRPQGFLAVLVDGSVHLLPDSVDPAVLKGLFTPAGGEAVEVPQ